MQTEKLLSGLFQDDRRWSHQGPRLVFWFDPEREFTEEFTKMELGGVHKLLWDNNAFTLKRELLVLHAGKNAVVYAPFREPEPRKHWLYDLQSTGLVFEADRAGMLASEFGFFNKVITQVIRDHLKFFASQERVRAFKGLGLDSLAAEGDVLLAMMCVLVRERTLDDTMVVRRMLEAGLLEETNKLWGDLERFSLVEAFWALVKRTVGYSADHPTLKKLFVSLQITHLFTVWPAGERAFPNSLIQPSNRAVVFIDRWKKDRLDSLSWSVHSDQVAAEIGLEKLLSHADPFTLRDADTFRVVDEALLTLGTERLKAGHLDGPEAKRWTETFTARKTSVWYSQYESSYRALQAAVDLLQALDAFPSSLSSDARVLFDGYTSTYNQVDRAYRQFVEGCQSSDWEGLQGLSTHLENLYVHRFNLPLAEAWSEAFTPEVARQMNFKHQQWSFFNSHVVGPGGDERVFVIISDALRFEVATEIQALLETELRGKLTLTPMLSTLPSKTHWGMAALLPGSTLSLDEKGNVLRDGKMTQGLENRRKILAEHPQGATALRLSDLLELGKEEAREQIRPYRVIYLYHDTIDATGDKAASERNVFKGVRQAIDEVSRGIRRIVNALNGYTVLLTADHGFQYQRLPIQDADKIPLPKGQALLESDRRYVLGKGLQPLGGAVRVPLHDYQKTPGEWTYAGARGTLRFAIQGGGAQYVHGGMSLQEMVVPVLRYEHVKASKGDGGASRKVGVEIGNAQRVTTNNTFQVMLVQKEAVSEKVRPRRVRVGLYHPQTGVPITDEPEVELASTSELPTHRVYHTKLVIGALKTDSNTPYILRVLDVELNTEVLQVQWQVRVAFGNDFGDF